MCLWSEAPGQIVGRSSWCVCTEPSVTRWRRISAVSSRSSDVDAAGVGRSRSKLPRTMMPTTSDSVAIRTQMVYFSETRIQRSLLGKAVVCSPEEPDGANVIAAKTNRHRRS